MNDKGQVIVIGADWHGEWAKDTHLAFQEAGFCSELIYTNSIGGGSDRSKNINAKIRLEKIKQFFRHRARPIFERVKKMRQRAAERTIVSKIRSFRKPGEPLLVVVIWTPLSLSILKRLSKESGITLILWQGEVPEGHPDWVELYPYFDHIFSVDEEWVPLFGQQSADKVTFLPLASSPTKYFPLRDESEYRDFISEVAFVGYYRQERAETLSVLKDHDMRIYGYYWEDGLLKFSWLKDCYRGPLSNQDANKAFNAGKIQIGRIASPIRYGNTVTQRVFDIALAGSFQLSSSSPTLEKMFGSAVPQFQTVDELKKLVDYYLSHPEERNKLALRAHEITLREHTYAARVQIILKTISK